MSNATVSAPLLTAKSTPSEPEHVWAVLAGLRGLFAFVVLGCHVYQFTGSLSKISDIGGFAAVLGFFVISGYSIAHSIESRRQGFYARRAQRIYPLYLAGCLLSLVPFWIFGHTIQTARNLGIHGPSGMGQILGNLVFLNGFVFDSIKSNAPAWSLSIEVSYYLLAPLFQRMRTPLLLGIVAASSCLYYIHDRFHVTDFSIAGHGKGTLMLAWAWLLGFIFYRHRTQTWAGVLLLGLGTALLCRFCMGGAAYSQVLYVVSMFLIIAAPQIKLTDRTAKALNYAGEISYSLYILHYPVMVLLSGHNAVRSPLLYLALPILVAMAAYHSIDLPFRSRTRRLRLSRSS